MKIENNNNLSPLSTNKADDLRSVDRKYHSADVSSVGGSKDRVEFSDRGRLLAKAASALDQTPDAKNERVEALRQQIDQGTYTVPIEDLAKAMIKRLFVPK